MPFQSLKNKKILKRSITSTRSLAPKNKSDTDQQSKDGHSTPNVNSVTTVRRVGPGQISTQASSPNLLLGGQNRIKDIREKTIQRENWNIFSWEEDYKTDWALQFKSAYIEKLYSKHLKGSSAYSMKILLCVVTILSLVVSTEYFWINLGALFLAQFASNLHLMTNSKLLPHGSKTVTAKIFDSILNFISSNTQLTLILINMVPFAAGLHSFKIFCMYNNIRIQSPDDQMETADQSMSDLMTEQNQTLLLHLILVVHNLPGLLINMMYTSAWINYGIITTIQNSLYLFFINREGLIENKQYITMNMPIILLYIIVFSLNEKIRKELFITNLTNSKTKRQMMKIFNYALPSAVVNKEGHILMYNEGFEKLMHENLKQKNIPQSILKFVQSDQEIFAKLQEIIQIVSKQTKDAVQTPSFEIVLDKNIFCQKAKKDEQVVAADKEQDLLDTENYYDRYEALVIQAVGVHYKGSKAVLIRFDQVTDLKAKNRLLSLHLKMIGQFMVTNEKRMENLHKTLVANVCNEESNEHSEIVGEFLGNSQVTMNMIQQINYYFNYNSNLTETKIENYVLSDEIDFCLDGLTASKWQKEISVFLTKGELPRKVIGDLVRFRICMRTLLEFGIKYTINNQMHVKCEFKAYTPEQHFVIQFSILLAKNPKIDLELLTLLLADQPEEERKFQSLNFDKQMKTKYKNFFTHTNEFGLGMIVFPSIVKQLKGEYFIHSTSPNDGNPSASDLIGNNDNESPQVKVGFKLAFEPSGMDSIISSQHYRINTAKKDKGDSRMQVYTTPQIRSTTRQITRQQIDKMSCVMKKQGTSIKKDQNLPVSVQPNEGQICSSNTTELASLSQFESRSATRAIAETNMSNEYSTQGINQNQDKLEFQNQNYKTENSTLKKKEIKNSELNNLSENQDKSPAYDHPVTSVARKQSQVFQNLVNNSFTEEQKVSSKQISQKTTRQAKNNLLQSTLMEGKPVEYFNVNNKEAQLQEQFISNRTAEFIKHDRHAIGHNEENKVEDRQEINTFSFMESGSRNKTQQQQDERRVTQPSDNVFTSKREIRQNVSGLQMPESTIMAVGIPEIESLKSENNDKVLSLSNTDHKAGKKSSDQDSEQPFNFAVEKFDSFMMESEEGLKGWTLTQNKLAQLLKEKENNQFDLKSTIWANRKEDNSQLLSKFIPRQIFNRFDNLKGGASKKLLYEEQKIQESQQQSNISEQSQEESQSAQNSKQEQVTSSTHLNFITKVQKSKQFDTLNGREPLVVIKNNIFIRTQMLKCNNFKNPYFKNMKNQKNIQKSKFKVINVGQNQDYIDCVVQDEKDFQQRGKRDVSPKQQQQWVWLKNTIIHPQEFNDEFDSMDKNQNLKIFPEILEQIEQYEKDTLSHHYTPSSNDQSQSIQLNQQQASSVQLQRGSSHSSRSPSVASPNNQIRGDKSTKTNAQQQQVMLIVEDNLTIQAAIQAQSTKIGISFKIAYNGQEACDLVEEYLKEQKMFDIILMDLYMPELNGWQAAEKIREFEAQYQIASKNIKPHFICAHSSEVTRMVETRCFNSGMDDVMAKPMNYNNLKRMIKDHDRRLAENHFEQFESSKNPVQGCHTDAHGGTSVNVNSPNYLVGSFSPNKNDTYATQVAKLNNNF